MEQPSLKERALIGGALIGALLGILLLIRYFTGTLFSSSLLLGFLERLVQIVGLYQVVVRFPFAPEKRRWIHLFGFGALVMFFASILTSFTTYLLFTFDPSLIQQSIDLAMKGLETLQPQTDMSLYKETFSELNPFILFFSNLLSSTLMGVLLSAAISAYCMLTRIIRPKNHFE